MYSNSGEPFGKREVGHLVELVVGHGQAEAVAEAPDRLERHLLLLVRDVLRLARLAHPVALDRLGEDDRRLARVVHRGVVRGVDLERVVPAAVQLPDVVVRVVGDQLLQLRRVEEVLADVGAVLRLERLVLAVDALHHPAHQDALLVAREQRIPVPAPDDLDHVPAGAAEVALELLDDLAVAAHRTVEALQVAVDDEDQVVEVLARRHADRAHRFGLVHLAVAHERPDLAAVGLRHPAVLQVLHEPRLVDRHQRPEAHRHRRELPEVRHQPGVRVRRDALAVDFLAEVVHLLGGEPAQHERARVDAGRRVALDEHEIAAVLVGRRVPEMVEADVVEHRRRREARDVAADVGVLVRAHHHRHRVPAHVVPDLLLDVEVARQPHLPVDRDRVDVGGVGRERQVRAGAARLVDQLLDQEVRAVGPFVARARLRARRAIPAFPAGRGRESCPCRPPIANRLRGEPLPVFFGNRIVCVDVRLRPRAPARGPGRRPGGEFTTRWNLFPKNQSPRPDGPAPAPANLHGVSAHSPRARGCMSMWLGLVTEPLAALLPVPGNAVSPINRPPSGPRR